MTALQQDPSAQAPWTRTMFGRLFTCRPLPSSSCGKASVSVVSCGTGAHHTILLFESALCAWDMLAARSGCRRAPRESYTGATRNSR